MRGLVRSNTMVMFGMFLLVLFFFNMNWVWKWMYPIYYPNEIRESALKHQVNPHLLLAIIQTESKFHQEKTSKKGAIGLMQLMEETAAWIIERGGYPEFTLDHLDDPAVNIELGSWYLRYLMNHYKGNIIAAVAAYNAGQGNVSRWLNTGVWDGQMETLSQIPYGETRHYVQRIFYLMERYEKIYEAGYWKSP